MERQSLNAYTRETGKGVSHRLRLEDKIPAIIYGAAVDSKPIYVDRKEINKLLKTDAAWNTLIDLKIDGKDEKLTRISDYQAHVLTRALTHIDFQVLDVNKKLKAEVPITLVGKAAGQEEGGIVELIRRSLEVKCLPTNIPEHIDVDISALNIGDNLHVEDLKFPEGVEGTFDTNFSIVTVVAPVVEKEPEVAEGEEAAAAEGEAPAEGEAKPAEGEAKPAEGEAKPAEKGEKK